MHARKSDIKKHLVITFPVDWYEIEVLLCICILKYFHHCMQWTNQPTRNDFLLVPRDGQIRNYSLIWGKGRIACCIQTKLVQTLNCLNIHSYIIALVNNWGQPLCALFYVSPEYFLCMHNIICISFNSTKNPRILWK